MLAKSLIVLTQVLALVAAAPAPAVATVTSVVTESGSSSEAHSSSSSSASHSASSSVHSSSSDSSSASAAAATTSAASSESQSVTLSVTTTSDASAQGASSFSYDSADLAAYYSSISWDVASFYKDFVTRRSAYVHGNQKYFNTHTFSDSEILKSFTTYTDDSFTTVLAASPELITVLASAADQFPWFSNWKSQHAFTGLAQSTSNSAESAGQGPVAKSSMNIAIGAVAGVSALFALSIF